MHRTGAVGVGVVDAVSFHLHAVLQRIDKCLLQVAVHPGNGRLQAGVERLAVSSLNRCLRNREAVASSLLVVDRIHPHAAVKIKGRVIQIKPAELAPDGRGQQRDMRAVGSHALVIDGGGRLPPTGVPVPGLAAVADTHQALGGIGQRPQHGVPVGPFPDHGDVGVQDETLAGVGVEVLDSTLRARLRLVAGGAQHRADLAQSVRLGQVAVHNPLAAVAESLHAGIASLPGRPEGALPDVRIHAVPVRRRHAGSRNRDFGSHVIRGRRHC